jgi:hypothetical protein
MAMPPVDPGAPDDIPETAGAGSEGLLGASRIPERIASAPAEGSSEEDRWLVQWVEHVRRVEESSRASRERWWRLGYDMLMNRYDFSGREAWQSQVVVSKVPNAINAAAAILKAGVTQTRDWWDLESDNDVLKDIAPLLKKLQRADLEERDPATQMDFIDRWTLGVKAGLATAPVVMKIYPREVKERVRVLVADTSGADELTQFAIKGGQNPMQAMLDRQDQQRQAGIQPPPIKIHSQIEERTRVHIEKDLVDPFDYYRDTHGDGLYEFQKIRGDIDELTSWLVLAETDPSFRKEAIQRAIEKAKPKLTIEESRKQQRTEERPEPEERRHRWKGIEYWGTIPGEDGAVLYRNYVLTVIEDEVCRLGENPFDDGTPFVATQVEPLPFTQYGRGFIESGLGVAVAIIELANSMLDAVKFEVLKAYEIDIEQISDQAELKKALFPGRVIPKQPQMTGQKANPAIMPIDTGRVPPYVQQIYAALERAFGEATNVSELTIGMAPVRATPTATEVTQSTQSQNVIFRGQTQWLEKSSLEPCLQKHLNQLIHFRILGADGDQWCSEVLGPQDAAAFWSLLLKLLTLYAGKASFQYIAKSTALSSIVARSSEIERFTELTQAMQGLPGVANRVDMDEYTKRLMRLLGYGSEKLLKSADQLAAIGQLENTALQNAAQGVGQQPRSNSGISAQSAAAVAPSGA